MFDKCKFSILLAFHVAFKISTKKKGMSSEELSEEYELRQKTCWEFKWKIQQAMQSSGNYPLTGKVHVDEFFVGGAEEGVFGRGSKNKRLVVVALEIVNEGFGRAYAEVIDDASAKSLRPFFERRISKNAEIITDEWISRGGSEASTIIARKRGFRGTWTSTTFGSIGEHPRTQSSMCSFVE
jgi:hypothetical protein